MEKLTVTATRMADCWPGSGYPLEWICKAYLEWAAGTLGEKFFFIADPDRDPDPVPSPGF
jgi:hypothetical protein